MSDFHKISSSANNILSEIVSIERNYHDAIERNSRLMKVLATIKTSLERCLKQPQNLNAAVYEAIDLARTVTPYTKDGKMVFDPPLTDNEKVLP